MLAKRKGQKALKSILKVNGCQEVYLNHFENRKATFEHPYRKKTFIYILLIKFSQKKVKKTNKNGNTSKRLEEKQLNNIESEEEEILSSEEASDEDDKKRRIEEIEDENDEEEGIHN